MRPWHVAAAAVAAAFAPVTLLAAVSASAPAPAAPGGAPYPAGPQPQWSTLVDGPRSDGNAQPSCDEDRIGRAVHTDSSGNVYVSGLVPESKLYFLLKFSANGDLAWQREFHRGSMMPLVPLLVFRESGDPRVGIVVPEHEGYSVHMFDAEGSEVWSSSLEPQPPETRSFDAWSATLSADGRVYVVGYRDFGSTFVARHSGDGPPDWVRIEPGASLRRVEVAGVSGIVAWGSGLDEPSIVRYDEQGNRLWQRAPIDADGWVIGPSDLEIAETGQIYFVGRACRQEICAPAAASLAADGSWLWSRVIDGPPGYEESFRAISVGQGRAFGLLVRGSSGARFIDIFVFDPAGQSQDPRSLGPYSEVHPTESFVDTKGWLRFTGSIEVGGEPNLMLGSMSPAGTPLLNSYDNDGLTTASCDLSEGAARGLIVVGERSSSFPGGFSADLVVSSFSESGLLEWTRYEPMLASPGDGPGSRMGPDRKGPVVQSADDGTLWVVGSSSRPGSAQAGQPVAWHFSAHGAPLGHVAPFGETGFRQWAESAARSPGGGIAMAGAANAGTRFPFVATFNSALEETMRYVDGPIETGWANAVFRSASGDLLVAQRTFELMSVSPTGELLDRVSEDAIAYLMNDAVVDENESVWMVGSAQAVDLEVTCVVAGLSLPTGLVWARHVGSPGESETCTTVDTLDGRVVAGGRGGGKQFVVSYDAAGDLEWALDGATDFTPPWSQIGQVVLDETGHAWISGRVAGSQIPSAARISPSGVLLWTTQLSDSSGDSPKLDLGPDGRGYFLVDPSVGWPSLLEVDAEGVIQWLSPLRDTFRSLRVMPGGRVVLTGSRMNVHSNDLLVAEVATADFLFADGFESGDMTSWDVENP